MKENRKLSKSIPGQTRVRNSAGKPLPCCWDDCMRDGYDEIKVVVREPRKTINYIFCSERHKRYYVVSHHQYGQLQP